jgi:hypothetical protein
MAPPGWSWCSSVSAFDQAPVINRVEIFSREFVAFVRVSALASVVAVVGSTPATGLHLGRDVAGLAVEASSGGDVGVATKAGNAI